MSKRAAILLLSLGLAVVLVFTVPDAVRSLRSSRQARLAQQQARASGALYEGPDVETIGQPEAPLHPIWVVPDHPITREGVEQIEQVKQWVRQHPNLVNLTIARMHTPEGDKVMMSHDLTCAGITIDGRSRFSLWDAQAKKSRRLRVDRVPGRTSYQASDVIDLFEQALENMGRLPRNRTLGRPEVDASGQPVSGGSGGKPAP